MAQQTQIGRVIPKYHAFIERFPTVESCANAPLADVLSLWSGLGYNRRAVSLWTCAGVIVREHNGAFPRDRTVLESLPGVGPYTARAIRVFAFECRDGVVDTNVGRVIARAIVGKPVRKRLDLQSIADEMIPNTRIWQWNQAIMEFGGAICTARQPQCATCVIQSHCMWKGRGDDPSASTATSSKPQARFAGSNRQLRGRVIAILRNGPMLVTKLIESLEATEPQRASLVVDALAREGMIDVKRGIAELSQRRNDVT